MKILHIINTLNPEHGGPSIVVKELTAQLRSMGHEIKIVTVDRPGEQWNKDYSVRVFSVGPGWLKYNYCPELVKWLKEHASGFDAVIVHGIWHYISFAAWKVLRSSKIPYFVFAHGMLDPWFKKTYPLKHIKKLIYWPWAEYKVLRDAKAVLFTSEEERILARESFGVYKCNEKVVNYGIADPPGDPEMQKRVFLDKFSEVRGKKILLFMGRIHPKKGCDILINAFTRAAGADSSLMLVMAGPDQIGWGKALKKEAKRLGVGDKVVWTGMLEEDAKWGALRSADAFILPSHQENFGIAVAEAMACGTPVLITNKVNIWREISADGAGLVSDDTLSSVSAMIEKWTCFSEDEKAKMAENALQSFRNRFRIEKTAEDIIALIRENRNVSA